jgi:hypothetical protein
MVVGFSSGLVAAGTGLVAIGAYAASAEARLNSKADILEGKLSKEVAALKGELSKASLRICSMPLGKRSFVPYLHHQHKNK